MESIIPNSIKEPFDPATLKVEVKNATIGQLIEMLKNDLIDLSPDFQRYKDLWSKEKKSQLIESILLGLPLPSFYFYIDTKKNKWVVIDGLQRLSTFLDFFIAGKLQLSGLQLLAEQYGGKSYSDLDYFERLSVSMHPVTLNVISGEAAIKAKYHIFQRLNSKGTPLTQAEIRNALYQGPALDMIGELASSQSFSRILNKGVSNKRMADKDYILRFVAFYITDYEKDYDGKMDDFLNSTLEVLNKKENSYYLNDISTNFHMALDTCFELLEENAFRKPTKSGKKNPISKTLFESTMVAIAHLSTDERRELLSRKKDFQRNYQEMFNDEFLVKALLNGTGSYRSVLYRFGIMKNMVIKTLKGTK